MAQVQKEEIRDNIIKAAIKEFKDKGYEKASMRSIATNADISVGNLYRYFSNKHNLFEYIVEPVNSHIMKNFECDFKMQYIDVNFLDYIDLIKSIIRTKEGNVDEMYILLERSKGSKYENVKLLIIEKFEEFINEQILTKVNRDKEIVIGDVFAKALATSVVEGISKIIIEVDNKEEFVQNMIQYIELTFKSTVRTLIYISEDKMNFRRLSHEEIFKTFSFSDNC